MLWILSFLKSWTYARALLARVDCEIVTKETAPFIEKIMKVCVKSKYEYYKGIDQIRNEIQEIPDKKIRDNSEIRFNKGISARGTSDYFKLEQIKIINYICSIPVDKKMYESWPIWDGLSFTPPC